MSLLPKKYYFDSIFDEFFMDNTTASEMKCDIYEKDGKYNIELDIPGFNKDEIKVECHDGYLSVTAEKNEKEEEKDKNYIKKERVYGCIQRQFYVGDIDSEDIKAEFKDGILKIVVPREDKKVEKKQITIE